MASILKVDTIQDQSGNNIINENADTITIGASGDTVNIVGTLQNGGTNFLQGITMADQWRLSANTNSGTNSVISTNWERNDDSNYSSLGTGLTESSGLFSFAQTGLYLINVTFSIFLNSGDAVGNVYFQYSISGVANNAAVVDAESQGISSQITAGFIFNVTNISTHKFRFLTNSFSAGTVVNGNTDHNFSFFTAIRLGDSQ